MPPNQAELILESLKQARHPGGLRAVRGRAARLPPRGEHHPRPGSGAVLLLEDSRLPAGRQDRAGRDLQLTRQLNRPATTPGIVTAPSPRLSRPELTPVPFPTLGQHRLRQDNRVPGLRQGLPRPSLGIAPGRLDRSWLSRLNESSECSRWEWFSYGASMTQIEAIQAEIESLSSEDFVGSGNGLPNEIGRIGIDKSSGTPPRASWTSCGKKSKQRSNKASCENFKCIERRLNSGSVSTRCLKKFSSWPARTSSFSIKIPGTRPCNSSSLAITGQRE